MSTSQASTKKRDGAPSGNQGRDAMQPWEDMVDYLRTYVRQEPEVAACVCLGVGFILGWKLKPW